MLRDDELYPTMSVQHPATQNASDEEDTGSYEVNSHANDDLDSIFGSAPSSPVLSAAHASSAGIAQSMQLQNGTGLDRKRREGGTGNAEISDIPRLKERHETEGYRDGVTKGKGESIQQGFDEGYTLGAVLGLRIGKVIGLLEGIASAVKASGSDEAKRIEDLLRDARRVLNAESVFGKQYWGNDGVWLWDVPGEKDGEVVFDDVVGAHPLVSRWEKIIEGEVTKWGINVDIWEGGGQDDEVMDDRGKARQQTTQKEVATEAPLPGAGSIMGIDRGKLSW